MPRVPLTLAALATLTSVIGSLLLVMGDTPYEPSAAALAALGMLLLTVVGAAGIVIAAGRWAVRLLISCAAAWLFVAGISPLTPGSAALISASAVTLVGLLGPWPGRWVRRTPSLDGPSAETALLLLALAATPAATGLAVPAGVPPLAWAWCAWALLLAMAISRAVRASLYALRFAHPVLAGAAALAAGLPEGLVMPVVAALPTALAWRREARVEITSPVPRREQAIPFPPELVPKEIMSAAGLDDRGRAVEDDGP